uniref:Peptidase M13 N-terminal domain-containing protein n=1 Tax=Amblyomma maculatum TaxID=34609 RepID=G3MKQ3_AMBMU
MPCRLTLGILWIAFCGLQGAATAEDEVCCTAECIKTVEQVKQQMGTSKPCEDFHNYICGNWQGSYETKGSDLKKKALSDLIDLLEKAVMPSAEIYNATNKLIAAYGSCTKQAKNTTALKISLKKVLDRYKLGNWPLLSNDDCAYQEILKRTGPRPLFRYFISKDDDSEPLIFMTVPSDLEPFGFDYADYISSLEPRNEEEADQTETYHYSEFEKSSEEAYKEFIKDSLLLLTNVTKDKAPTIAEDIFLFEKNLSKIAAETKKKTEKMNISQLNDYLGDNFPMDEVLQTDFKVLNITISKKTEVKVESIDYYVKVVKFLKSLTSTAGLSNYIMWKKVRDMAKAEETGLHELYLQYKNKTAIIPEERISNDTRMLCLLQLLKHDIMYSAAANFYSEAKFDREARNDVLKIMRVVNSTFIEVIKKNTWMSNHTKEKAIERITQIVPVIGYPEWVTNNSVINYLYQFVPRIEQSSSFVESFHWLQENEHFQKLFQLTSSYFDKTNEDVTLRSHGFYAVKRNTMGYPAASLATHYRKPGIPRAMNFGTIGTLIAQLLTTAIDRFDDVNKGSKKQNNDFWDDDTATKFCKRSSCLNNTEECYDKEGYHNSSYEQLHDYFGVRVSHIALKQSKQEYENPFLLPGKQFDTEDKIFFTTFGSLYCPYSVNEKKKVEARAFLPEENFPSSLNEIVSQYHDFNTTFDCYGDVNDTCQLMPPQSTHHLGGNAC